MTREEVKERMVGISWNTRSELAWDACFHGGDLRLFNTFLVIGHAHESKTDTVNINLDKILEITVLDKRISILTDAGSVAFHV